MTLFGAYTKWQMVIADNPKSPRRGEARRYLERLTKEVNGNFLIVFNVTQAAFIIGLGILLLNGIAWLAYLPK